MPDFASLRCSFSIVADTHLIWYCRTVQEILNIRAIPLGIVFVCNYNEAPL